MNLLENLSQILGMWLYVILMAIDDCIPCSPAWIYKQMFMNPNLSCVSYMTVFSSVHWSVAKSCENCVNAGELQLNALWNFVYRLVNYCYCSRFFVNLSKIQRNIVICYSKLLLDRPGNFERTFSEKSWEQRTKFVHFTCITFAKFCNWDRWCSDWPRTVSKDYAHMNALWLALETIQWIRLH